MPRKNLPRDVRKRQQKTRDDELNRLDNLKKEIYAAQRGQHDGDEAAPTEDDNERTNWIDIAEDYEG